MCLHIHNCNILLQWFKIVIYYLTLCEKGQFQPGNPNYNLVVSFPSPHRTYLSLAKKQT